MMYRNTQVKLYIYAYLYINCPILHTVHRISCCPRTDQILLKLPAPYAQLSCPVLEGGALVFKLLSCITV